MSPLVTPYAPINPGEDVIEAWAFGCHEDNATDDTAALDAALEYASTITAARVWILLRGTCAVRYIKPRPGPAISFHQNGAGPMFRILEQHEDEKQNATRATRRHQV